MNNIFPLTSSNWLLLSLHLLPNDARIRHRRTREASFLTSNSWVSTAVQLAILLIQSHSATTIEHWWSLIWLLTSPSITLPSFLLEASQCCAFQCTRGFLLYKGTSKLALTPSQSTTICTELHIRLTTFFSSLSSFHSIHEPWYQSPTSFSLHHSYKSSWITTADSTMWRCRHQPCAWPLSTTHQPKWRVKADVWMKVTWDGSTSSSRGTALSGILTYLERTGAFLEAPATWNTGYEPVVGTLIVH